MFIWTHRDELLRMRGSLATLEKSDRLSVCLWKYKRTALCRSRKPFLQEARVTITKKGIPTEFTGIKNSLGSLSVITTLPCVLKPLERGDAVSNCCSLHLTYAKCFPYFIVVGFEPGAACQVLGFVSKELK